MQLRTAVLHKWTWAVLLLEHPHIVHHHGLWELGAGIRISRPVAANRNVHDEKELRVEWIRLTIHLAGVDAVEQLVVQVPRDVVLLPKHREQMKGVTEFFST